MIEDSKTLSSRRQHQEGLTGCEQKRKRHTELQANFSLKEGFVLNEKFKNAGILNQ